jgi:6-phosphogluconolactonase
MRGEIPSRWAELPSDGMDTGCIDLLQFDTAPELARAAAARWLARVETAGAAGRNVLVAVSGGRIAAYFFAATAQASHERGLKLDHVHFFWADERCVPPDDSESNFLLAQRNLLSPLRISDERIHRIRGELAPSSAAKQAAADLVRWCPADPRRFPALDFVFLGMGEDGHVASLFPGEPDAVRNSTDWYRAVAGPKSPTWRVTMSYGLLAAAREVWVLASGPGKEDALRASLAGGGRTPLAWVIQSRSLTRIFTDIAAG